MTKTIEMVVKVEVSEPVGVTVDNDMVRSLAAESIVKVRSVPRTSKVGTLTGVPLGQYAWATVRATVQAFGEVKTVAARAAGKGEG